MKYDYLIVGAGLFGATVANRLKNMGKKVLVIDKRNHIAGNIYTEEVEGIQVHRYGAHIFHTDYKDVWDYVNSFVEFNRYTNSPVARIGNEIYNMPFNMNTFAKIWDDVFTPMDALKHIEEERKEMDGKSITNLEEQAISLVGRTIYEKLVKSNIKTKLNLVHLCNSITVPEDLIDPEDLKMFKFYASLYSWRGEFNHEDFLIHIQSYFQEN